MRHNRKLRITQKDFLLANRRASRAEEIEAHGKQIQFRSAIQKSKKVYDRNRLKRAAIKSDDGSFISKSFEQFFLVAYSRHLHTCLNSGKVLKATDKN